MSGPASVEASAPRCGWFGEGRGQCLLPEGHSEPHRCEQDERLAREKRSHTDGKPMQPYQMRCAGCGRDHPGYAPHLDELAEKWQRDINGKWWCASCTAG